mgnify:CR=1 FL=1
MFNAIAQGEAVVENFLRGADCLATLNCLRLLGVQWHWQDDILHVTGAGKKINASAIAALKNPVSRSTAIFSMCPG